MIVIVLILSKEFPQSVILSKSKKHNRLIKSSNSQICFIDFLESRKVHLHALIDQNVCNRCHKTAKHNSEYCIREALMNTGNRNPFSKIKIICIVWWGTFNNLTKTADCHEGSVPISAL